MSRLFRTLCVSLCAAVVATLSLHGVQEGRHQIAHASDWPAVAIGHDDHEEIVDVDHGSLHVHIAPDAPADDPLDRAEDPDNDGDAARPTSHHHHTSGDSHTPIPIVNRDLSPPVALNAVLIQPAVGSARPTHEGDGPEYPPRRTRTII